jgi:hypothetical protein
VVAVTETILQRSGRGPQVGQLGGGFKSAEDGGRSTITAANVKSISSDPKDASLIAYYQRLLGSTP